MKRIGVVLGVALVAASCNTQLPQEMSYSDLNALALSIIQRCVDQGVEEHSPEMETCFMHEARRETNQRIANRQAMANFGQALQAAGMAMQASQPPPPRHTTCTRGLGGMVNCTTW